MKILDNLFPGAGRRLDGMKVVRYDECCLSVNQSMKKLKMTDEDSKVEVDRKPLEFNPFLDKSKLQVNVKGSHEGFKPFRGKCYILG